MARLEQAKLGLAAEPLPGTTDAASNLPDPEVTPDDPTDMSGLELLPHCQWAVGCVLWSSNLRKPRTVNA